MDHEAICASGNEMSCNRGMIINKPTPSANPKATNKTRDTTARPRA